MADTLPHASQTGARIQVAKDNQENLREITLSGGSREVEMARAEINAIVQQVRTDRPGRWAGSGGLTRCFVRLQNQGRIQAAQMGGMAMGMGMPMGGMPGGYGQPYGGYGYAPYGQVFTRVSVLGVTQLVLLAVLWCAWRLRPKPDAAAATTTTTAAAATAAAAGGWR